MCNEWSPKNLISHFVTNAKPDFREGGGYNVMISRLDHGARENSINSNQTTWKLIKNLSVASQKNKTPDTSYENVLEEMRNISILDNCLDRNNASFTH